MSKLYRVLNDLGDAVYETRAGLLVLLATRLHGGSWMLYEDSYVEGGRPGEVADTERAAIFNALVLPDQAPIDALNTALDAGDEDEAIRLGRQIRSTFITSSLLSRHFPARNAFVRLEPILRKRGMLR